MSLEQITPDRVDLLTDVYSMGVVLYELLTGRVPFDSELEAEVRRAIVQDPPVPPRQINPSIAPEIERIVLKALQKRPEDRFPGCGDFALHIERNLTTGTGGAVVKTGRKAIRIPLGWIRDALQKFTLRRSESAPAPSPGPPQSSAPADSSGPPPSPVLRHHLRHKLSPAQRQPTRSRARPAGRLARGRSSGRPPVAQFAAYVRAQEEEVRKPSSLSAGVQSRTGVEDLPLKPTRRKSDVNRSTSQWIRRWTNSSGKETTIC
jgi:serine/threonine protein kinase